jgi:hypothetical protein
MAPSCLADTRNVPWHPECATADLFQAVSRNDSIPEGPDKISGVPFQYPSQRFQDWLSQRWVMWRGSVIDPAEVGWLMGPFGDVDIISDRYVERLARSEDLVVERAARGAGLLESVDDLMLAPDERARLRPEVVDFYERTADHDLEFWSEWSPLFRPFGGLIRRLYSRRLQQLNLPLKPLEASRGVSSEILKLRAGAGGTPVYTIWYRILKSTSEVIYSGIYGTCRIPDGRTCVKVVFPLPRGNATVIMSVAVGERGELTLTSAGDGFGSPGFYFLLRDSKGRYWGQYIRSFRETITAYVDEESVLRGDHVLTLWRRRVLGLHYKITPRPT